MDKIKIKYDPLRKVLKTIPISYRGVKVVFSHISTDTYESKNDNRDFNNKSIDTFIDCYYTVNVDDNRKPLVVIELIDLISEKLYKWGKMLFGSNKVRLNPKLILKREGYDDVQIPPHNTYQHYETPLDIIIGADNEKILETFTGQGQTEMSYGRLEYWIDKYSKVTDESAVINKLLSQGSGWTYVEDSKLCFSINMHVSNLEFVSYIQEKDIEDEKKLRLTQCVEEVRQQSNVTESFNLMEDLPLDSYKDLGGLVPSNTPLKIKNLSPLSKQLFEILIYFYGDDSYDVGSVLPGLSKVYDDMSSLLEPIDDAYVRIQTNVFFNDESIKNNLSYYPDSTTEAEETLFLSLLTDWIYENN